MQETYVQYVVIGQQESITELQAVMVAKDFFAEVSEKITHTRVGKYFMNHF